MDPNKCHFSRRKTNVLQEIYADETSLSAMLKCFAPVDTYIKYKVSWVMRTRAESLICVIIVIKLCTNLLLSAF